LIFEGFEVSTLDFGAVVDSRMFIVWAAAVVGRMISAAVATVRSVFWFFGAFFGTVLATALYATKGVVAIA